MPRISEEKNVFSLIDLNDLSVKFFFFLFLILFKTASPEYLISLFYSLCYFDRHITFLFIDLRLIG
jgi:hypothetical protein